MHFVDFCLVISNMVLRATGEKMQQWKAVSAPANNLQEQSPLIEPYIRDGPNRRLLNSANIGLYKVVYVLNIPTNGILWYSRSSPPPAN